MASVMALAAARRRDRTSRRVGREKVIMVSRWRVGTDSPAALLREHLVHELDAYRTLPDRCRDPLDAVRTHVADCEDPRPARLEQEWPARQRPPCRGEVLGAHVRARPNEGLLVHRDAVLQPAGVRVGTRHQKNMSDVGRRARAPSGVAPGHALEPAISLEPFNL